jgi:drug/metabolite transporter (DMT)-like permease
VAALLALISTGLYGGADFLGGLTTRRAPAATVVVTSHLAGGVLALAATIVLGGDGFEAADLGWGAAAGAAGALGLVVLYHGLATTRFAVVGPTAALSGALVPILFGVAAGERPDVLAWIGVVVALPALLLIPSGRSGDGLRLEHARRGFVLGLAAGAAFGLFSIFLSRAGDHSGVWPLVGARMASIPLIAALAIGTRRPLFADRRARPWALGTGIADMAANIFFLMALQRGLLSLVVVITSLYPAVTVALARGVLAEEVSHRQYAGVALAAVGVALISLA